MKKSFLLFLGVIFLAVPAHGTLMMGSDNYIDTVDGNPKLGDFHEGDFYTLKIEFGDDFTEGTYTNGPLTVEIFSENGSFGWSSNLAVCGVIVKGGPMANLYHYYPETAYSDSGLIAPYNENSGKHYGVSHIEFSAVPEPASMLLLGTGLVGFVGLRKKLKK
jgi:hypothetical protein